jgi:AcrR family transcriptional regulator
VKKLIAVERVKGATLAEIGKKVGLSPKTVEKHVATAEVKALMREYAERHSDQLDESYRQMLASLTRLMQGDNQVMALEAVDRLIHLLGTTDRVMAPGRGQDQQQAQGSYTLAELTLSLERYVASHKD